MLDTEQVTFSQLVQHPRQTIEDMRSSGLRALRLSRRDAEDLILMWASRAAQEDQIHDVSIKLFAALMRTEEGARQIKMALPEVLPWAYFLPAEDIEAFAQELIMTARAAGTLDNPAPLAQLLVEWRHTAEVHADPALRSVLTGPIEDFGPVTPPSGVQ